jgi:uncharacterized protein YggE
MKGVTMFRRTLLLAIALLVIGVGAAYAQEVTPVPGVYPTNTITVSGFGSAAGEPDVAYTELGVEITDPDLANAFSQTAETMNRVISALVEAGVERADIQTTGVNVYPQERFDPTGANPTPERVYLVRNTVRVTARDVSQVETLISAAVGAGANTIYNLNFGIEDTSTLEQEARVDAVADARERAEQLAAALGVTVGQPIVINEVINTGGPIMPFSGGGLAGANLQFDVSQPVSAGQLNVTVAVQITFAIGGAQ